MNPLNPLDHPICLSLPLRVAPSAWTEHVPFAMFLIDVLRPRVFVEIGTYYGVSYCAFCQAVKNLGLDSKCYAVDTWRGDPQGGFFGSEVLADLRSHHDPLYGSFSRLIQGTFDEALVHFADGSIDLLHVDGYHTYDAVKGDFENWLPKMSDRGVMIFHDTNVRESDFGVWRFWEQCKREYPHFEVMHGCGLGVLAVGQQYPAPLRKLLEASESSLARVREFFYQLGLQLETARQAGTLKQVVEQQSEAIKVSRAEAEAATAREQNLRELRGIGFLQAMSKYEIWNRGWGAFDALRHKFARPPENGGGRGVKKLPEGTVVPPLPNPEKNTDGG